MPDALPDFADQLGHAPPSVTQNVYTAARSGGKTTIRGVRVPDELWQAAQAKAEERGEILSAVIRAFLVRYVKRR